MAYVGFFGGLAALVLALVSSDPATGGLSLLVALALFALGGLSRGTE